MGEPKLIDRVIIESLRELGESTGEPLLAELIRIYLETAPVTLGHLRRHLSTDNLEDLVKSAHSLKSSSSALGLVEVQRIASALEAAGRDGDLPGAKRLMLELEQIWEPSKLELVAHFPGV
jgi:HPt (histidine-containing phosphotransfer) domain-containing protein